MMWTYDRIRDIYDVDVVSRNIDSIISITFVNKNTNYTILLTGVYISHENSVYGDNVDLFFDSVINIFYENPDCDMSIIYGDFNSRIGAEQDFIEGIDDITESCH